MTTKLKLALAAGLIFGSASIALADVGPRHKTDFTHPSIKSNVHPRDNSSAAFAWAGGPRTHHASSRRAAFPVQKVFTDWAARPGY